MRQQHGEQMQKQVTGHVNRECGPKRMNEVYSYHYITIERTSGAETMRLRNNSCFQNYFFCPQRNVKKKKKQNKNGQKYLLFSDDNFS